MVQSRVRVTPKWLEWLRASKCGTVIFEVIMALACNKVREVEGAHVILAAVIVLRLTTRD